MLEINVTSGYMILEKKNLVENKDTNMLPKLFNIFHTLAMEIGFKLLIIVVLLSLVTLRWS